MWNVRRRGRERGSFFVASQMLSHLWRLPKKARRKNSWEVDGINVLCHWLVSVWPNCLVGVIDSREKIDLWLLQGSLLVALGYGRQLYLLIYKKMAMYFRRSCFSYVGRLSLSGFDEESEAVRVCRSETRSVERQNRKEHFTSILNHLMARIQFCSFGELRELLHRHYNQIHSNPGW